MTKCPYVPPHEGAVDLPHLMLRQRATQHRQGKTSLVDKQLAKTDRNGRLGGRVAPVVNWATKEGNALTRPLMEKATGIDRDAYLLPFASRPLADAEALRRLDVNQAAPAARRKVALYATCYANWNVPGPAQAALKWRKQNGGQAGAGPPGC